MFSHSDTPTVSVCWRRIRRNTNDSSAPHRIFVELRPGKYEPTQICSHESAAVIKHGTRFKFFSCGNEKTPLLRRKHPPPPEKCRASPHLRQTALKTEEGKCARRIFLRPLFRKVCQEINHDPYCSPQVRSHPGLREFRPESAVAFVIFWRYVQQTSINLKRRGLKWFHDCALARFGLFGP